MRRFRPLPPPAVAPAGSVGSEEIETGFGERDGGGGDGDGDGFCGGVAV